MHNPSILKINTIHADWTDNDIVMLHACFALLADCIENEKLFDGHTDWSHTEETISAKKEIQQLYDWWLVRKKDTSKELDRTHYDKDNEMLIRLIKVRHYLWT